MDSAAKFSFSFYLAILFHLLLLALFVLALNSEPIKTVKPVAAMQATVVDIAQIPVYKKETPILDSVKTSAKIVNLKKKHWTWTKKRTYHLAQLEKKKVSISTQVEKIKPNNHSPVEVHEKWHKKLVERKKSPQKLAQIQKQKTLRLLTEELALEALQENH